MIDFEEDYPQLYTILHCFDLHENENFIKLSYDECLKKLEDRFDLYYIKYKEGKDDQYFEDEEIPVYFPLDDNWTEFLLRDY